jgi:hypothetical protein
MSRIPALDLAQVDPKAKPLLDAVQKSIGVRLCCTDRLVNALRPPHIFV